MSECWVNLHGNCIIIFVTPACSLSPWWREIRRREI
jgi:hypothetical protein